MAGMDLRKPLIPSLESAKLSDSFMVDNANEIDAKSKEPTESYDPCLGFRALSGSGQIEKALEGQGEYEQPHTHLHDQLETGSLGKDVTSATLPDPGGLSATSTTLLLMKGDGCGTDLKVGKGNDASALPALWKYRYTPSAAPSGTVPIRGQENLTVMEASLMMFGWLMNIGLFSFPFIYVRSGLSTCVMIICAAGVCIYTAKLLGHVLAYLAREGICQPTFTEAAEIGFGKTFAVIVTLTCHLEMMIYGAANLIALGITLNNVMPSLSFDQFVCVSCAIGACLSVLPRKAFAYLGGLSAFVVLVICCTVLISGCGLPEWAENVYASGDAKQIPGSFSMVIFTGGAHPLLPSLFASTDEHVYQRAIVNGWSVWAAFACCFGTAAYCMFGSALHIVATQNIGHDLDMHALPAMQLLVPFSAFLVLFRNQLSVVVYVRPFTEIFDKSLGASTSEAGALTKLFHASPIVMVYALLAVLLKDKVEAMEYIAGSILMNLNAIVFPSLLYLRVCTPKQSSRRLQAAAMAMFGILLQLSTCGLSAF